MCLPHLLLPVACNKKGAAPGTQVRRLAPPPFLPGPVGFSRRPGPVPLTASSAHARCARAHPWAPLTGHARCLRPRPQRAPPSQGLPAERTEPSLAGGSGGHSMEGMRKDDDAFAIHAKLSRVVHHFITPSPTSDNDLIRGNRLLSSPRHDGRSLGRATVGKSCTTAVAALLRCFRTPIAGSQLSTRCLCGPAY